jgi:hypothetical protein
MRNQDWPLPWEFIFKCWEAFLIVYELIVVYIDMDVVEVINVIRILIALNPNQ